MTKRQKLYTLIPIFLVLVLINKFFIQEKTDGNTQIEGSRVIEVITKRVHSGLTHSTQSGQTSQGQRSETKLYVPPEGKVIIRDGKVKAKEFGLTFHPGFDYGLAGNGKLSYGLDAKVVYLWRLGGTVGIVGLTKLDYISPAVGLSYSLAGHSFLLNTELDFKYAPRYFVPFWAGLRWNF